MAESSGASITDEQLDIAVFRRFSDRKSWDAICKVVERFSRDRYTKKPAPVREPACQAAAYGLTVTAGDVVREVGDLLLGYALLGCS